MLMVWAKILRVLKIWNYAGNCVSRDAKLDSTGGARRIDVNEAFQRGFVVARMLGFPSACFGGVDVNLRQTGSGFEFFSQLTVRSNQGDDNDAVLIMQVVRNGLCPTNVRFPTGSAVVCI